MLSVELPGKRQHYVPKFLLRRFAIDATNKKSLVWRLDKKTGKPERVNPVNEVVIGRYYRIVLDDGTVDDTADELLDRIETMATEVIVRMGADDYVPLAEDVFRLILFIVTLKNRTPQAREALRETDEQMAEMWLEVMLSDREHYHRVRRKDGRGEAEVEAERLKALDELRAGRIGMESGPDREVALMFTALEKTSEMLFENIAFVRFRVPQLSKAAFVLSDHPVSHYDPTPKTPEAGASFMSSDNSLTFVPLDPTFGLLLVQGQPQTWKDIEVSNEDVDELNLLTYAWAREAIYGPSQEAVTRVRRLAKRKPKVLAEFRYRPPRIWVAEIDDSTAEAGPHDFTSRFKGQKTTRTLHVSQEGVDEARRRAWAPSDEDARKR